MRIKIKKKKEEEDLPLRTLPIRMNLAKQPL